ncbi:hypothetical protein DPMN_041165 [Dreissena polymorpha]|uniref:Uncharacterized protein n=1 Tax=Dreissena polymorpha TaxID=45954 RepID=A0A9D4CYJ5_DREPO|nr:hypothetical protein DPMN_041165 [Dreissena polymorpha]
MCRSVESAENDIEIITQCQMGVYNTKERALYYISMSNGRKQNQGHNEATPCHMDVFYTLEPTFRLYLHVTRAFIGQLW